ncbi:MAG: lamin tail domain-containing protein [Gracilimonas sp.]|nr:lamin tail domain-containing protein [Gracilimonas sp.]
MLNLRLHIVILLIFVPISVFAQTVNFEDDFSDQDISDWSGTLTDFTFITEGNNVLLQQDAAAAGTSYLSISSSNVVGYWEFFLRLDGFSPSDGNKAEIYLMSDGADLTTSINGYMLQAGENLSGDVFRLFRITGGTKDAEVLTGTTDISSGGDFRVKVTRDASGNWSLEVAEDYTGLLTEEASGTDNTYTAASHLGFITTYTSTRTDKFAFDFKIDIPPIAVDNVTLFSDSEIDITFNKAYDPASVQTTDFTLFPGTRNPQSFSHLSAESLRISFSDPIPSGVNDLNISGVDDLSGSTTIADTTFHIVVFDDFEPGDIVINEFMKDPPTGASEYIEIHNASAKYLNLRDWQIGDNGTVTTIGTSNSPILPNDYVVISADTSLLRTYFGSANYILASLPTLNNGDDEVRLFDNAGATVDSLSYTSEWGGVDVAIERRDPSVASIYLENWGDSPNPNFGTPGTPNEVSADTEAPQISEVILQESLTLLMVSSERLENITAENPGNYSLSLNPQPGVSTPVVPLVTTANQIAADTVELTLDNEISEYDGSWNLDAADLTDIFGNSANGTYEFEFQNPFVLAGLTVITRSQLLLEFSESVDPASIQPSDFMINSVPADPGTGISQPTGDQIQLDLTSPLASGPSDIILNDLQSVSGWTIKGDTSFEFFIFDEFADGDIIINEFMKDPPSSATDYVELRNTSSKYLNLKNWQVGDELALTTISDSDFLLYPDSYTVITPDTSALINTFGPAYYIQASLPNLNSTTSDQVRLFTSVGAVADSLQYERNWGGENVALERRDPTAPSIYKENWGNSPSPEFGTPGSENLIPEDVIAPNIVNLNVIDESTLQVLFTERIQLSSAENIANYELTAPTEIADQVPPISSVTFLEPDTVIIQFQYSLPKQDLGATYELSIQDQADIFGNIAGSLSRLFFLIDIQEADSGDVVINEFMYDPAIAYSEFIELYNKSDKNIDLQNWTLNDNTGNRRTIANSNTELVQGGYVILVPDSSLYDQFSDKNILVLGTAFPSLNNSSDDIVIRDQNGTLIDSLTYLSDWGGDQVSLERLDPVAPSIYSENWGDSPSPDLATPGTLNDIAPDTDPPLIIQAFTVGTDTLRLRYNERIQTGPATNTSNYTISPNISIDAILQTEGNVISIALSSTLTDGTIYSISIQDQLDIFGNLQSTANVNIEFTQFSNALPGDIIVNEILYRRLTGDSPEFVELYNQSAKNFDLSNWTFADAANSTTLPFGTQIKSGEYLILTDTENFTAAKTQTINGMLNGNVVYLPRFPSLNDNDDVVVIKNGSGMVIDSVSYKNNWGGDSPGVSLERKDPLSASNDLNNWASSIAQSGNTAGTQSSVFEPDQDPPQVIFAKTIDNDRISLIFSEFVVPNNAILSVNESSLSIYDFDPDNGNQIIAGPVAAGLGKALNLSISNIEDYRGNVSNELSIEVSQPLTPGSVVINEIMFDPLADSEDNLPDQTEYIELYNRSDYAISLEGLFLHDAPDENNEVRPIDPVSSQYKWIPSNNYVLIYAEDQATEFDNSRLAKFFEISGSTEEFKIRIDRSSLSLASTDDAIYIADSTKVAIDSVFYDESWHNPNLFDTDGVALERIDPNGPGNDDSNWSSSTRVNGGTPAEQNSIYQIAGSTPVATGLAFTPNPFSPDDDGFEDNLFLNYKLDESDYLLRVRIFDRYGRQVKQLADGKPAGFEGSLIWDGLTDERKKNRVGIYIILFEAYNSANGKNKTFKNTVVLARKFQ